jgi:3-oxoacyl-[acyl-carrier protein] reductase
MGDTAAIYPDLRGKVAVVTGGSAGIGLATAEALVANGATVVVNGRDATRAQIVAEELQRNGGEAFAVAGDVSDQRFVQTLADDVAQRCGRVDLLVAFAGGFDARTPFDAIGAEEWDKVIHQNLTSVFYTLQAFLPSMAERGGGAAVTMASNAGRLLDMPLTASYAAAKAGVVMLTRHVAQEYGPAGVRVNCVAPGTTLSPRVERLMSPEVREAVAGMAPLGRLGMPADTASATVFLLSEAASWLTGITIDVAGGRVMI